MRCIDKLGKMDKDTSIRVKQSTKKKLDNLSFVKKHSYNDIILENYLLIC